MVHALGVQSHANLQVTTGSLSAEPEPRNTMETLHVSILLHTALQPHGNQHSLQTFPVVTGPDTKRVWILLVRVCAARACVCASVCASVRVCAGIWNRLLLFGTICLRWDWHVHIGAVQSSYLYLSVLYISVQGMPLSY